MTITVNDVEIDNEDSATWDDGENTVEITVEYLSMTNTYTVTVTKS